MDHVAKNLQEYRPFQYLLFPKYNTFTGRIQIIKDINGYPSHSEGTSRAIVVLYGLGGVGKSQIANEYIHRYKKDYKIRCWLRAEGSINPEDYKQLAKFFGIPENEDNTTVWNDIMDRLKNIKGWLFIFDNADNIDEVERFLPNDKAGSIIVTSCSPTWENVEKLIQVPYFNKIESVLYIISLIEEKNQWNLQTMT